MKGSGISAIGIILLSLLSALRCSAVEVATVAELQNAVQSANNGGDKEILLGPGIYNLNGVYLRLSADNISIAGTTGKRGDVIVDGGYVTTEIFQIVASNITLKDLTLKRALHHPIHISPENADVVGTLIRNVHIIDPGQQAVKINQNSAKTYSVNHGRMEKSRIELTGSGRQEVWNINGSCYTGGIDAHHAAGWSVADNVIVGFWCPSGLSEHGVHFWSDSRDTVVERNTIINCDRGIGFGLGSSGHNGGIIRNNMIYHDSGHQYSDVGISLESAAAAQVYNNTIFHEHDYPNAIEYRFAETAGGFIANNLTNGVIASRNGGTASLSHNVTTAGAFWFMDIALGDLHLLGEVDGVVDSGMAVAGLREDFDGERRPLGGAVDIGADEWMPGGGTESSASASPWLLMLLRE
jgi:hypothetical protein